MASELDERKPSMARVYDHLLGGKEHFAVDREVSEALFAAVPEAAQLAVDDRALLARAVRHLVADLGIRQLIDLGSGLPTEGNVHEVAHEIDGGVHVVYVGVDPIVLAHGRALLSNDETTTVVAGDVRDSATIFDNPELTALVDTTRPFAVLASGVLQHFDDDTALRVAAALRDRLSPGSYVFYGHFLDDDEPRARQLEHAFLTGGIGSGRFRSWDELGAYFDGLDVVEPGLVYANEWHPDATTPADSPVHTMYAAGLARRA